MSETLSGLNRIHTYIYLFIYTECEASLSSAGTVLHIVGGDKVEPFLNVVTTSHVLCKHSNGERASLSNLKFTIGMLLVSGKSFVNRLS